MLKVMSLTTNGFIRAGTPTTSNILKTFDPKIFPKAISYFLLIAALRETINSGREVPTANAVIAIKELEMFKNSEIFIIELIV